VNLSKTWSSIAILGILGLIAFAACIVTLGRHDDADNRIDCASNMRQIGQAILLYEQQNHGTLPDRLESLFLIDGVSAEIFVCPRYAEKAPTSRPADDLGIVPKNVRTNYVYRGAGLTKDSPSQTVVLYEPLINHDDDGSNVLFVDGHVEWSSPKGLAKLLATTVPTFLLSQRAGGQ
jgi:prepilin-type processing-associated H-X9-DG protein